VDIILIGGLWLDGSIWADVVSELEAAGHRPVPIDLPGQGAGAGAASLEDQVAAVTAAVDATEERAMVVGHSAAVSLAWIAADRRPDRIAKVVLIGGFPSADGETYADLFETVDGFVPFPGWEPFEGPDAADLDEEARRRFEAAAIAVPETVTKGVVALGDERLYDVPVVVICPEFSPADARGWIDAGEAPELARARHVELVDIDSGHWPMLTQPAELARILGASADRLSNREVLDVGLDDWRKLAQSLHARFLVRDYREAAVFFAAVAEIAEAADHHPDLRLTYGVIDVSLCTHRAGRFVTQADLDMAARISEIARAHALTCEPAAVAELEIALDTAHEDVVGRFWAVLLTGSADNRVHDSVFDPTGRVPGLWFQGTDEHELPRQRWHLDCWLAPEVADARIAAAVEAGGVVVDDSKAPSYTVLADPDGNRVCVCTAAGR
jgi:pterin-4a-carbinolamine dehydratase/pimeloyl-ACP methyl ester carboxylesterase